MSTCHSSLFAGTGWPNRVVALFSLAFVFLVPQPGRAEEPLTFFKNYFVTGDHVVRGASLWRKGVNGKAVVDIPALGGINGVPATADILAAFLYVQTAERIQGSGINRAKFDGVDLGPFTAAGSTVPGSGTFAKALVDWDAATAPCWSVAYPGGRKLQTYRVDVLRFLPIDPVTGKQSLTKAHRLIVPDAGTIFDDDDESHKEKDKSNLPRAIGASIVVIYRDAAKPFAGIVIYDGAYKKGAFATMQQTIKGFYQAATNPSAKMTHIVGDGRPFLSERVYLGPTLIATNPFVSALGAKWDNTTFPNALAPAFPLASGAAEAVVTVAPHTLLSDCVTYSGIVFSTTVQDTDTDGLLDIWESSNTPILDPNGEALPNLKAMGADPQHSDLFAEIGYMYTNPATSPDGAAGVKYGGELKPHHTHLPAAEALQMVAEAFKNAPVSNPDGFTGITVHFDVGDNYQLPPPFASCANPQTWTFACAIVPASVARGGEAIDELVTICNPNLLASVEPWVCQFSDHVVGGTHTGGYPGTVGWKTGYRFLRDRLISATPPANIEECNAPGNDGPGEPCERQFDDNRKQMFHYLLSVHSVGIPQEPCQRPDGPDADQVSDGPDLVCQQTNRLFHSPRTNSAIADIPGSDTLLSLGWFDDAAGRPVGTPYMQGATIMHEWGHNFELKHGGPANTKVTVGGTTTLVPQIPRQPNCKSNYLSVMNYLFQLRGLPDVDGIARMDFSREVTNPLNESSLSETLPIGSQLYRTGWYAPFVANGNAKAATKHCNGEELTPEEQQALDAGGGMMRVDATSVLGNIDWNLNGVVDSLIQDINFDGAIEPELKASVSDWDNIRLNELAARRNVGGLFIDSLGRLAVGPMSLDVGQGDIGQGDIGQGDIGQGDIGQGDIGQGDIGQGDIGQGDIGRGLFGGGDLDVGGNDDPKNVPEMDPPTAAAVEGAVEGEPTPPGPPNGLRACLTSDSETCVTQPGDAADASTPVNLAWKVPTLEPAKVQSYKVYRFDYEGEFVAPAAADLPDEPIATVAVTLGATDYEYADSTAPSGTQLAYFVRGRFAPDQPIDGMTFTKADCKAQGGTPRSEDTICRFETSISNFDTVTTPTPVIFYQDLGTTAPPGTLGGQTMTPFGDDTRPANTETPTTVTTVPSPLGGSLSFSSAMSHVEVNGQGYPAGWRTWSHGYSGDVYYVGEGGTSVTMTLPVGTTAFYFYAEPRNFGVFTFTITTGEGETFVSSGEVGIEGDSGAHGFGFYASHTTIASVTVTSVEGANGFSVGEFGIAGSGFSPPGAGSALDVAGTENLFDKIWGPGSNGIVVPGGLNYSTQPGVGWAQQYGGIYVTSYSLQAADSHYLTDSEPAGVRMIPPSGAIVEVWDLESLSVVASNISSPGSGVIFFAQPNHRYGGFAWYADNSQTNLGLSAVYTTP